MSRDLFGFNDEPFSAYPDNKYFFSSILHDKAITLLEYGLNSRKGFMLLTGLKGTGKTMTCNILKDSVTSCNVSKIDYEGANPDKLMQDICTGFGLEYTETGRKELFGRVMEFFVVEYKEGNNNLIIVDNAEKISDDCLHMLSEFMEIEIEKCKLVQVIISGCPELHDRLRNIGGDLGPKFTFTVELAPLSFEDTAEYVEHRIKTAIGDDDQHLFKSNSYSAIYDYSKGVPSEINRIAQKALALAKENKQSKITPKYIKMAAARLYGIKVTRKASKTPVFLIIAVFLIVGAGIYFKNTIIELASNKVTKEEQVVVADPVTEKPVVEEKQTIEENPTPEKPVAEAESVETTEQEVQPEKTAVEETIEPKAEPKPVDKPVVENTAPNPEEQVVAEPVVEKPKISHGCITANSGLKVRAGASVTTDLIGTAPFEAYIELIKLSADGKWWKTMYHGKVGYMYAKYIRVVESPEDCGN